MIRIRHFAAAALIALSACSSTPTSADLDIVQRRAVVAIQAAQRESTAALVAGTITVAQDRAAQAKLATARKAVVDSKTVDAVAEAAKDAGVTP